MKKYLTPLFLSAAVLFASLTVLYNTLAQVNTSAQIYTNAKLNPLYAESTINPLPEHWLFTGYEDSVSGSWSYISPLQQALYGVNSYYWEGNGKVFVCGGQTQDGVPQSACWWYDPVTDSYQAAAPLPHGRWSGKLVKVKDSLYLIGSVDSTFASADGMIFRYSLTQNSWVQKSNMPAPYVHECASAVVEDDLIVVIGGSLSAFVNPINYVRTYNPSTDQWRSLSGSSLFPVNNTSAHAECLKPDTTDYIFVLGGYGSTTLNTVFKGTLTRPTADSIAIAWELFDTLNSSLFGVPIYRVAGGKLNSNSLSTAVFGPGMNAASSVNVMWGLTYYNDTDYVWNRFTPRSLDTIANISTVALRPGVDSNSVFLFGGFKNPNVVSSAMRYTFPQFTPPPIGVINISQNIPEKFRLWQNYPNPFNPETKIKFSIPQQNKSGGQNYAVKLTVYDITGREVKVLVNGSLSAGEYETVFNGSGYSSGAYFYVLQTDYIMITRTMIIIK